MKWRIGGFLILLIVLFTLVIRREQKSGGTCYEQQTSQGAENPPSLGKKQESPQQANTPAGNSENYLCRLIAPANLPTDYLVLVGIGAVWAALLTLDAIKRQADLMESSLVSVQRAFVFCRGVESGVHVVDVTTNTTTELHFWLPWENSGTTPTKGLEIYVCNLAQNVPMERGYNFPNLKPPAVPYVLGPKATTLCGPLKIPVEHLIGVQQGTHHIYIWGRADYWDVFKGTPKHSTKFCWKIASVLGDLTKNKAVLHFAAHSEHNCADEDCK